MGLNDTGTIYWVAMVDARPGSGELFDYMKHQSDKGRRIVQVDCPEHGTAAVLVALDRATLLDFSILEGDRNKLGYLRRLLFVSDETPPTFEDQRALMARDESPDKFPERAVISFR